MRLIDPGKTLGLPRGAAVICMPVAAADERTLAGVRNVVEHSDSGVPTVLVGQAAPLEAVASRITGGPTWGLVAQGVGATAAVNEAVQASRPADVVLLAPGVIVAPGWFQRLRSAATSDSTVASATPLSIGAGAVELLAGGPSGLAGHAVAEQEQWRRNPEDAARAVGDRSLRLYPRIAIMGPGCVYVRRAAWELAGPLDDDLPLHRALERLAGRALALGMVHVAADDVLVAGAASDRDAGDVPPSVQSPQEDPSEGRILGVQEAIACDERGPLRRSLLRGRMALRGLSVTIDGRALTTAVGGTQTYILGLILALARAERAAVRVLVAPDISQEALQALTAARGVELLSYEQALRDPPLTDVVHRPQQIFTADDLALLRLLGQRIVVGQQDLIAYHNDTYHPDVERWRAYRRTTRLALAGADQVVFFSEHGRRDALAEDLLPARRAHVVGIGVEALVASPSNAGQPEGLRADDRFLLCLGADYAHKNRPFAIELLGALRELGWDGRLVLAGTHVPHGSSREEEAALLARNPGLKDHVLDLGSVAEASKRWLYAHACALLYPTLYEGFGLIPLEAARADLPCLFAPQASLSEVAPNVGALVAWDAPASARAVLPMLSDGPAREEHLAKLRGLPIPGWDAVAREMLTVYERALVDPPSEAAPRAWQELDRESYIVTLDRDRARLKEIAQEYQDAYHGLDERVHFGLSLIDRDGLLSVEQQRALMRIASLGRLGALALAPLGLLGRRSKRGGSTTP
jgi:glycosyltransferase involved in cell wall biosynthesis